MMAADSAALLRSSGATPMLHMELMARSDAKRLFLSLQAAIFFSVSVLSISLMTGGDGSGSEQTAACWFSRLVALVDWLLIVATDHSLVLVAAMLAGSTLRLAVPEGETALNVGTGVVLLCSLAAVTIHALPQWWPQEHSPGAAAAGESASLRQQSHSPTAAPAAGRRGQQTRSNARQKQHQHRHHQKVEGGGHPAADHGRLLPEEKRQQDWLRQRLSTLSLLQLCNATIGAAAFAASNSLRLLLIASRQHSSAAASVTTSGRLPACNLPVLLQLLAALRWTCWNTVSKGLHAVRDRASMAELIVT